MTRGGTLVGLDNAIDQNPISSSLLGIAGSIAAFHVTQSVCKSFCASEAEARGAMRGSHLLLQVFSHSAWKVHPVSGYALDQCICLSESYKELGLLLQLEH